MSTIPTTSAAELEFQRWMKERVSHFEWFAEKMLPQTGIGAKRLVGAMGFAFFFNQVTSIQCVRRTT